MIDVGGIRLDISGTVDHLSEADLFALSPRVTAAADSLAAGTCTGSGFLGWLDLPENITGEERLFVAGPFRGGEEGGVGEWYLDQLRLRPLEAAAVMDPAEELSLFAPAGEIVRAVKADAAVGRERRDYPIPHREPTDVTSDLDDLADQLVAEDSSLVETGLATVIDVEIRSADGGQGRPDDDVGLVEDLRIRDRFAADLFDPLKRERFHRIFSRSADRL